MIKLSINIDHIATLRNIRNAPYPNILLTSILSQQIGINTITMHLRLDKRHINEFDIIRICRFLKIKINIELALNNNLIDLCSKFNPYSFCFVPENISELTTEKGLNVIKNYNKIENLIKNFNKRNIKTILFVDPIINQIKAAIDAGAKYIEMNSGDYANLFLKKDIKYKYEFDKIKKAFIYANKNGLKINIGHGINYFNIKNLLKIPYINEINIGHSIVSESIYIGWKNAIYKIKSLISNYKF